MPPKFETFEDFLANARQGRRLTNSIGKAPMTRSRLQSLIRQGFGQGRDEMYVPWIRVTRGNAPRQSNHIVAKISAQNAPLHLMSAMEHEAARVASWLGANEIRSQFPLFPWSGHPHPTAGLCAAHDAQLAPTRGLLEIAQQAGIKHGTYVGAPDLPYVATSDLAVSLGDVTHQQLMFWAVKPAALLRGLKPNARMLQRIHLERLYADSVGAKHVLYDGSHVNPDLLTNLDWLEPLRSDRSDLAVLNERARFVTAFKQRSPDEPLRDRIAHAAQAVAVDITTAQRHFRTAAWMTEIDIDLSRPILMSLPMTTGGGEFKTSLFVRLTGEQL
jgi:hypothetical protein